VEGEEKDLSGEDFSDEDEGGEEMDPTDQESSESK
jgi:hypothetical protein